PLCAALPPHDRAALLSVGALQLRSALSPLCRRPPLRDAAALHGSSLYGPALYGAPLCPALHRAARCGQAAHEHPLWCAAADGAPGLRAAHGLRADAAASRLPAELSLRSIAELSIGAGQWVERAAHHRGLLLCAVSRAGRVSARR